MAPSKVGEFTLTEGMPPEPSRTSKYDALRDAVLKAGDWRKVGNENGGKVEGMAQTLRSRYGKELEVITRKGELWVRPRQGTPPTRKAVVKKTRKALPVKKG